MVVGALVDAEDGVVDGVSEAAGVVEDAWVVGVSDGAVVVEDALVDGVSEAAVVVEDALVDGVSEAAVVVEDALVVRFFNCVISDDGLANDLLDDDSSSAEVTLVDCASMDAEDGLWLP